jgi:hypothetical protein
MREGFGGMALGMAATGFWRLGEKEIVYLMLMEILHYLLFSLFIL